MKKLSSILTAGVMGAIMAISFTGCGANIPQPYSAKVQNYSNITNSEKNKLLLNSMKSIKKFYPDKRGRYSSPSKLRGDTISYYGLNATFAHKFTINNNSNEITRTDVSRETHGNGKGADAYGALTDDFGFTDYINTYQVDLSNKFSNSLERYSQFKISYNKHKKNANIKKEEIRINFNDLTSILPKSILDEISKSKITISNSSSAINLFLNGKQANVFTITSNAIKNAIDRYKVNYKENSYSDSYDKFPSNITYEIDKVYFNYLPIKFITSDDNIDIEVKNNPLGSYDSIEYIKVYNKTKEFIEIDTIAGYYSENVTDNIINIKDMKRVKISPMSYKIFKTGYSYEYRINDYPSRLNRLLLVNDRNQKVNYGFSIGYKMINQNIIKNLYKVNQYSIKDFK